MPETFDRRVHAVIVALLETPDPIDLSAISPAVAAGREAYPEFEPSASTLGTALARAMGSAQDARRLHDLDHASLWLGAGCVDKLEPAVREFDRRFISGLGSALGHMRLDPAALDDVKQTVRESLLVDDDRILDYAGRGALQSLVRVIGLRTAVDRLRQRQRRPQHQPTLDEQTVDALVDGSLSPELDIVKRDSRGLLKEALQSAIGELDAKDRTLLRLSLLERLNIDEIAALNDVHRSTAARWIAKIRDRVGAATRRRLRLQDGLGESAMRSLCCAVDSQLDLSLSRLLRADEDRTE